MWLFKINESWKAVVFKRAHIFCSQFWANSLDEVGSRQLFFPLFSGALWTPFKPGPAAARCWAEPESSSSLLLDPALWVPDPGSLERCPGLPWVRRWSLCSGPGAILGAGSSSSAPICARRCWRNPLMTRYLLTPGSRRILLLWPWALGDPCVPWGSPGRRALSEVTCVVRRGTRSKTLWRPGWRVPGLYIYGDPEFCALTAPAVNYSTPFPELVTFKGTLLSL